MSGHSKWATTKRQKAVVDAKRGALFTKIANQIAIAARGGTDPNMNPSLAMVLEKARQANMPKANIERAIARVADKSAAALIEEVYEAYGPGGVGIIIEVATDNKNRTMPEVRTTLTKNGGRMADPGSVMFQFAKKGYLFIPKTSEDASSKPSAANASKNSVHSVTSTSTATDIIITTDDVDETDNGLAILTALDAGAEDVDETDDGLAILTAPGDLMKVRSSLLSAGFTVTDAELKYIPTSTTPLDPETSEKLEKLLTALDDLDDITAVHCNAE